MPFMIPEKDYYSLLGASIPNLPLPEPYPETAKEIMVAIAKARLDFIHELLDQANLYAPIPRRDKDLINSRARECSSSPPG